LHTVNTITRRRGRVGLAAAASADHTRHVLHPFTCWQRPRACLQTCVLHARLHASLTASTDAMHNTRPPSSSTLNNMRARTPPPASVFSALSIDFDVQPSRTRCTNTVDGVSLPAVASNDLHSSTT
jgi:hypothetical protein